MRAGDDEHLPEAVMEADQRFPCSAVRLGRPAGSQWRKHLLYLYEAVFNRVIPTSRATYRGDDSYRIEYLTRLVTPVLFDMTEKLVIRLRKISLAPSAVHNHLRNLVRHLDLRHFSAEPSLLLRTWRTRLSKA